MTGNASIDQQRENREVTGHHIGLMVNPPVYRVFAEVLSRLQQKRRNANLTVASFSELEDVKENAD